MDETARNLVEFFTDSCDTVQLVEFINEGLDVNAPLSLEDGRRPLHVAATNGNVDMVEALLDRGVDVDVRDYRGNTALHYAAREGHRIVVCQLLHKGADPNLANDERGTILQNAVCFEHVEVTRHLLSNGASLNATIPTDSLPPSLQTEQWYFKEGVSRLCLAFKLGNLALTHELISAGADVMAEFDELMCIAIKEKNLELVTLLLERRADIKRCVDWKRFLDVALSCGCYSLVDMFLGNVAGAENRSAALKKALCRGHLYIAKLIINRGAELCDELVNSSLRNALINGHTDVAEWLFRQEPQELPSQREYMNYLVEAIRNENIGIIRLIVDRLDNIDARTADDIRYPEDTALIYATQKKLLPAIELLLEKGADARVYNADGKTALFYAIQGDSYLVIVKAFVKWGISVNAVVDTRSKSTALHIAATKCRPDLVEYLLQNGADVNSKEQDGSTPFHRLLQNPPYHHLHLIKQFVDMGANLYHVNKSGVMPIDLAIRDKHRLNKESPEIDLERFFVEECFKIVEGHFKQIYSLIFEIIRKEQMSLMKLVLQKVIGFYYKEKVMYRDTPNTIVPSEVFEKMMKYEDSGINLLHYAAFKGDERLSDTALQNGVDIDALTNEGFTALQIALYKGNTEVAQHLISKGAKVSIVDGLDLLPFHVALLSGYDTFLDTQLYFETCLKNYSTSVFGVPLLHWAAYEGNVSLVKFLLSKGLNINTKDYRNNTILHIAVKIQNCELGDFLLKNGIDKNAQDANGDTALHLASRQVLYCGMSLDIPQSLLSHDVDVDITNNSKATVLHSAASTPLASAILAKGVHDINALSVKETSPLHCLTTFLQQEKEVTFEATDQVILFLEHDANVTMLYWNGKSILEKLLESKLVDIKRLGECCKFNFASIMTYDEITNLFIKISFSDQQFRQKRQCDLMEVLLSQGFTLNEKTCVINLLLHHVIREENTDLFKLVLENDRQLDLQVVLSTVICDKEFHLIKLLLDKIDVNSSNNFDVSIFIPDEGLKYGLAQRYLDRLSFKETSKHFDLLVRVVKSGYTSIAKNLLDKGAYINAVDAQSNTALHYAAVSTNKQLFHLLLSKGARVDHFNMKNETPIHFAAKAGNYDAFKSLLDQGANLLTTDVDGNTLLHKTKSCKIARTVMDHGVQVNVPNSSGRTALHCMVASKNGGTQSDDEAEETAALLIYEWAKVNEQDSAGMAPLHLAAKNNYLKTTTLLIERGAKIDLIDQRKQTALHHAVSNSNDSIVNYLLSEGALSHVIDEDGCSPHSLSISNPTIRNLFNKLSMKEELVGLPSEKLSGMSLSRYEEDSCLAELNQLRETYVHEKFSLFEIFSSYLLKPKYLLNEEREQSIERFLSSSMLMSRFPHYRGILKSTFKKSKRSWRYVKHKTGDSIYLLQMFRCDTFFRILPLVLEYLSVEDMDSIVAITNDIVRASEERTKY